MTCKTLITAFVSIFAASSALASQAPAGDGAPQAPETALYCMKVEAVTGNDIRNLASHLAAGPATVSEVGAGAQSADWQNMMASVPRAA